MNKNFVHVDHLYRFLTMQPGDTVIVSLRNKEFIIVKIEETANYKWSSISREAV